MVEKCPLGPGLYWDNTDFSRIPDICMEQCGDLIDEALRTQVGETDIFDEDCLHAVEHGGMSLQYGEDGRRYIGMLKTCEVDGIEAFADTYTFDCPNN